MERRRERPRKIHVQRVVRTLLLWNLAVWFERPLRQEASLAQVVLLEVSPPDALCEGLLLIFCQWSREAGAPEHSDLRKSRLITEKLQSKTLIFGHFAEIPRKSDTRFRHCLCRFLG
jgi:hypothetical protein